MSFFVQAANALATDVRSFVDDMGRGFMSGGIAGAIYVLLCRSRSSQARQAMVVSACGLVGVGIVLLIWIAVEVL
ncbi:MAG TPA: hypothetical protein VEW67_10135 [Thermoleophilaceae bacterium]|nr:hypothetical protein [Thermoleophilaceae bacterium]